MCSTAVVAVCFGQLWFVDTVDSQSGRQMSLVVAPLLGAVAAAAASAVAASTVIRGARLTYALFEVHYGDHTS